MTSVSGTSDRHRCDKVDVFDESGGEGSRKFLSGLVVKVGQRYDKLVMVGVPQGSILGPSW